MAYSNQPNIKNDRFGNAYQLKFAKQVVNKKSGEVVDAHECYVELGGKLYHLNICHANATDKRDEGLWVKVTKKDKQKRQTSM